MKAFQNQKVRWTPFWAVLSLAAISLPCHAAPIGEYQPLDFSIQQTPPASKAETPEMKSFHYRQQSSQGVSLLSHYELNKWFQLELDMKGLTSQTSLFKTRVNTKAYSAFANFGRSFSFHSSDFRPFAKVGLGYKENHSTYYDPNHFESNSIQKTHLQYGLGIRYSRQNWNGFGVSFSYQTNSKLLDQTLGETNPQFEPNDSVGLKIDFGF